MPIFQQNSRLEFLEQRVRGILLQPKAEWDKIDTEPTTIGNLFKDYVVILAAIPSVCGFLGAVIFGYGLMHGVFIRPSVVDALMGAIFSYALRLLSVFLIMFVINFMAPIFHGQKDERQAFKVAAYSATAAWVAGIFSLIPILSILGLLGLYSVYLLYLGLPKLMKTPPDRALPYTATVILAALVIVLIVNHLTMPLMYAGMHTN